MQLGEKAVLLRIFIGESDRFGHHPLYEAIVLKAREQELAGATVFARTDGLWSFEPPSYRQGPASLRGSSR